jgi:hypothetical protein
MIKNKINTINKEYVEKFVYYDETSPTCLRWQTGMKKAHQPAGGESKVNTGYTRHRVQIEKTKYIVARIVMVLHGHNVDEAVIDHVNGDPLDNQLSNLKLADATINSRNIVRKTQNLSGFVGVKILTYKGEVSHFVARWVEDGAMKHKSFNVKKHGYDEARKLAADYRKLKLNELNTKGYDYSDRHINQVLQND